MLLNRSISKTDSESNAEPNLTSPSQQRSALAHPIRWSLRSISGSPSHKNEELPQYCFTDHRSSGGYQLLKQTSSDEPMAHRRASAPQILTPTSEQPSYWKVTGTVVFYLVAAIVMVFANKWVLRATSVPVTFLLCQLLLAVIFLQIGIQIGYLKIPAFSLSTSRSLFPLVLVNVVGLVFNTYCLQYVDASFYQVARGLILPFTVLASYLFLNSKPSLNILYAVSIVCLGFFWGVKSEQLHTSRIGVFLGVFSSITTSIHAIVVKRSLSITSSPIELAYYNNLFSALMLLPMIPLTTEISALNEMVNTGGEPLRTFIVGVFVTGIFGFLICLAGFLSIKVTSPVTHMISSAVRGVIQTGLGILLFKDVVTVGRLAGIGFILLGSIAYTAIKERENRAESSSRSKREMLDTKQNNLGVSITSSSVVIPIKSS